MKRTASKKKVPPESPVELHWFQAYHHWLPMHAIFERNFNCNTRRLQTSFIAKQLRSYENFVPKRYILMSAFAFDWFGKTPAARNFTFKSYANLHASHTWTNHFEFFIVKITKEITFTILHAGWNIFLRPSIRNIVY